MFRPSTMVSLGRLVWITFIERRARLFFPIISVQSEVEIHNKTCFSYECVLGA